jgi:ADP-ribose pyrophosphatase YjhB (NUDIX family)
MTLGVRAIATDEQGKVLLVRHTYASGWHLPGGGVEPGETALSALVRELREEGGVETASAPVLVGCYANHVNFPNDHILVYWVEAWRPCPPRADNEIAERGFFALDALPPTVTGGTKRRLAEAFEGAPQSPHW